MSTVKVYREPTADGRDHHLIAKAKYDANPDAYRLYDEGEKEEAQPVGYIDGDAKPLKDMTVPELQKVATAMGITEDAIEGSGANGGIVKQDWIDAIGAKEASE